MSEISNMLTIDNDAIVGFALGCVVGMITALVILSISVGV